MSKPIDNSIRKYDSKNNLIEKCCKKCNNWFGVSNFFKQSTSVDGYLNVCKPCQKGRMKKQYQDKVEKKKGISHSDLDEYFKTQ